MTLPPDCLDAVFVSDAKPALKPEEETGIWAYERFL